MVCKNRWRKLSVRAGGESGLSEQVEKVVCRNRWKKLSVRTGGEWSVGTGGESDLK